MRFHQQRDEAEYNIQQYKKERQQKIKDRDEEKKRDMDMLKSYNPWGRPGGGAPMVRNSHCWNNIMLVMMMMLMMVRWLTKNSSTTIIIKNVIFNYINTISGKF